MNNAFFLEALSRFAAVDSVYRGEFFDFTGAEIAEQHNHRSRQNCRHYIDKEIVAA